MSRMPEPDADAAASRPRLLRIAFAWGPALAYMAVIWWLSSMPIVLPLPSIPWRDKAAHVMQYGTLGALVARAVRGTWPQLGTTRALLWAALITAGWGYLDEVHQAFVPGRDANAFDLLADAVGALLGTSLYGAALALLGRKRHPQ
jgi:VanZ family protein